MKLRRVPQRQKVAEEKLYSKIKSIDGNHSLKTAAPGSYVEYRARTRHGGKVFFFNFELAKEMGLIPQDHPHLLNEGLSKTILDTFSLVIINEYDRINRISFKKSEIRPNKYMATRYLQLQHPSRKGTTSGDGRGIWNGEVKHRGVTWDIASSGTGATRLSPATALQKTFFKTGDKKVAYGNGYGSLDDNLSAALMSEIFAKNGIETERPLAIIEFSDGSSINVRAAKSLLRPSHFFSPLKQNDHDRLKATIDYFIERQMANGDWPKITDPKRAYAFMAEQMALTFSKTAARFESDYIFCWMDWDGDNILANGGIIDYGSVRQFGLYHHEYRYDDVDRFSTKISEQRIKARYIVQTFAQIRDFLIKGSKQSIVHFRNDPVLHVFDKNFSKCLSENLLHKVGFSTEQSRYLLKYHSRLVTKFKSHYGHFEKTQSSRGVYDLPDGVTCDAIFCMRDALRELPLYFQKQAAPLDPKTFVDRFRSSYAKKKDLALTNSRIRRVYLFQETYLELIQKTADHFHGAKLKKALLEIGMRASLRNPRDRITGDGVLFVTDQIIKDKRGLSSDQIHQLLSTLVRTQLTVKKETFKVRCSEVMKKVLKSIRIIREYRESI